ncbi:DEAD/DEAH box helicase family protein [Enterococcus faecium]|uniref:DEAD/DEAH box helicase family protein n=1 Tax=Enterococcus TaxID=1350 RepID=UPI00223C0BBF|nr:DEAD/DEAH box helicase family protein [Enterococcus faecium]MCS8592051.1 DEAD/DEAH box helicase [Enterococcus faecium]
MNHFWGRRLLTREIEGMDCEEGNLPNYKKIAAVEHLGNRILCHRCGVKTPVFEGQLADYGYFCIHCLSLGRCDSQQEIYLFDQPKAASREVVFSWTGQLTEKQTEIAERILYHSEKKHHLIWAVTGAGKTEMLYPILVKTLKAGGRVAICTPRIDVCNELFLRYRPVFPEETIMLLHGNTTTAYTFSSFVICTIHQLYRFYRSFDLLVIDEIDAFPYSGDAGLAHAVQTAIKPDGRFIYLSATPDEKLLKEIKQTFELHKLALRFHRRLLPEPVLVFMNNWRQKCGNKKKINSLVRIIQQLIKENRILLFCPSITMMHRLKVTLQEAFPEYEITDVSSQDDQRAKKVQKMREATYEILLTTMILERGVTFERISVIVLGADHPVFTKSSLVQIAGRADRKGPYTNSRVYFFYEEKTSAIRKACQEIKEMNEEGKKML